MSLPNAPFGFRPIKTLNGGDIRIGRYTLASSSARVFKGDVLDLANSSGLVTRHIASSVERVVGVAAADSGVPVAGGVANFPVYDDPSTVFEAQCNNATAVTQVKFGNPFRIVATTGDTSLGYSKEAVNITTATAASVSNCVFAIRLAPQLSNDLSAYSIIECTLAGDPTKIARA
jgi:hypothetical protein